MQTLPVLAALGLAVSYLAVPGAASAGSRAYVGLFAGHGLMNHRIAIENVVGSEILTFEGVGGSGLVGGVVVGYEFDAGRFRHSVEIEAGPSGVDSVVDVYLDGFGGDAAVKLEWLLSVAGRVGYELTDGAFMFGRVGYGTARYSAWIDSAVLDVDESSEGYAQFVALGLGMEAQVGDGPAVRAEYTYHGVKDLVERAGDFDILMMPSFSTARLSIVHRF